MSDDIHLHDVVAVLENLPARHFSTGEPVLLRRGQVGAVVMAYDGTAFDVEFADSTGRTYALLLVDSKILMPLRYQPELSHA